MTLFAWEGNRRPTESDGSLPPYGSLKVTCGLTACTPESARSPTLEKDYGRTVFVFIVERGIIKGGLIEEPDNIVSPSLLVIVICRKVEASHYRL